MTTHFFIITGHLLTWTPSRKNTKQEKKRKFRKIQKMKTKTIYGFTNQENNTIKNTLAFL